jgi:hypothetical protein
MIRKGESEHSQVTKELEIRTRSRECSCSLHMLHCTEVSLQTVAVGQERSIYDGRAMSAVPPIATGSLHYDNLRCDAVKRQLVEIVSERRLDIELEIGLVGMSEGVCACQQTSRMYGRCTADAIGKRNWNRAPFLPSDDAVS